METFNHIKPWIDWLMGFIIAGGTLNIIFQAIKMSIGDERELVVSKHRIINTLVAVGVAVSLRGFIYFIERYFR